MKWAETRPVQADKSSLMSDVPYPFIVHVNKEGNSTLLCCLSNKAALSTYDPYLSVKKSPKCQQRFSEH